MEFIKNYLRYSFDFEGVMNRKEFWFPFLINLLLHVVFWCLIFLGTVFQLVAIIFTLLMIVPNISAIVRRLHDTDRSGLYALWLLAPFVGLIIVMIFLCEKTKYFV